MNDKPTNDKIEDTRLHTAEQLKVAQAELDQRNATLIASLSEDDQNKFKVVQQALDLLGNAGIPTLLFASLPVDPKHHKLDVESDDTVFELLKNQAYQYNNLSYFAGELSGREKVFLSHTQLSFVAACFEHMRHTFMPPNIDVVEILKNIWVMRKEANDWGHGFIMPKLWEKYVNPDGTYKTAESAENMVLPTLYSRTSTGAVQQWTIETEGDKYRTHFGQTDGKQQTTAWTVCIPKNTGRPNATSGGEQAIREAKALWKKKKESGCFEDIKDIDVVLFTEPMLAKKYEDYADEIQFPAYSQPKLDGVRMIARKDGLWSRNGKKFASVPHIEEALKPIFELYPTLILDGELYCNKFSNDFNAICSLVKKTKPTEQDLKDSAASIQYWIYDTITNTSFEDRFTKVYDIVHMLNHHSIKAVPTIDIFTFKDIDAWYGKYIYDGFEGQMIRTNGPYENKRSKNLLKRKEFQDKEYIILDVIEGEGNRSGGAGAMTFENEQGIRFNSNIKGTREYCTQLLREKDELIGKQATVKYFNLTPDNIPRFPFVVAIRNYEG